MARYLLTTTPYQTQGQPGVDATSHPPKKQAQRHLRRFKALHLLPVLAALALLAGFGLLRSAVLRVGQATIQRQATQLVHQGIQQLLAARADDYRLTEFVYDQSGKLIGLQADTWLLNQLSAQAAEMTNQQLAGLQQQPIAIPLGALLGADNPLSAYGPKFAFRVMPSGVVTTSYYSQFAQAGINQTRHQIILQLKADLRLLLPAGGQPMTLQVDVPVCDTILLGDVPQVYLSPNGQEQPILPSATP